MKVETNGKAHRDGEDIVKRRGSDDESEGMPFLTPARASGGQTSPVTTTAGDTAASTDVERQASAMGAITTTAMPRM
jgi:hypothetical protein